MTYTNIPHLRPMNRPINYTHSEYASAMQDARNSSTSADATSLSFDVSFLDNPGEYPHKLYIARS